VSNSIDTKVVELKFQSDQFKSSAASTLSQLEALKKGLDLQGATKGLDEINSAGKRFNLDGMGQSVQGLVGKFDALKVAGIAALATLASQATMYGQKLLSSMTEGITSGFSEYELKMGSIQTILANTAKDGTNLQDVTGALDELNKYADKTIYNFGDMTRNIGLFTNAGIKLKDATSMIKGFSNEAAASGTTSEGAAGAAYQLSQALSSGTIRLMDWKSLTNVGMGNKNMQHGIIEIAEAMGTFKGSGTDANEAGKHFNETLEKGWLSADVMSNYLKIMAGDMDAATQKSLGLSDAQVDAFSKQQKTAEDAAVKVRTFTALVGTIKESIGSSWTDTFDMLIGNFDSATLLFTSINEKLGGTIGKIGDARNKLIKGWADLGGRDVALEGLTNIAKALVSVFTPIKEAFREIFPPTTSKQLYDITVAFRDFTKGLILGKESSENLKSTFKGFFALLDIGWSIIKGLVGVVFDLFGAFQGEGTGGVLAFTGSLSDGIVAVRDWLKEGGHLAAFFALLGSIVQAPVKGLIWLGKAIGNLFQGFDLPSMDQFLDSLGRIGDRIRVFGQYAKEAFGGLGNFIGDAWAKMQPFLNKVGEAAKAVGGAIKDAFKSGDYNKILDTINTGLFGAITIAILGFFKKLKKFKLFDALFGGAREEGGGFLSSIKETLGGVTDSFKAMQQSLKAKTLMTIAIAIGILTASVIALTLVDSGKLTSSLTAMTVMFGQLAATMIIIEKFALGPGAVKLPILGAAMVVFAAAMVVMASAVAILAKLDWDQLAKGLTGLAVMLGLVIGTAQGLRGAGPGMIVAGAGMVIMAAAVKILVSAVKDLAKLNWDELARGLVGVGSVMAAVLIFTKLSSANKGAAVSALNIILIGSALKLLASAVKDFSDLDVPQLVQGLIGVGVVLGLLVGFAKVTKGAGGLIATGIGIVAVASGMKIMAAAVKEFGKMQWDEIGRGLTAFGGSLAILAIVIGLLPPSSIIGAAGLVVAATAVMILAKPLLELSKMNWGAIGQAVGALGITLAILSGAMLIMQGSALGAVALIVAAAALKILVPPLIALSQLNWGAIGQGAGALGIALAILAVGGVALLPAIPGLIGLGVAIGLIGIGVGVAAFGLGTLALGLVAIGTSGPLAAAGITAMVTAILNLIPLALTKLGEGIVAFATVIGESGPALVTAFVSLLQSMLDAVNQLVPSIITTVFNLMDSLISAIAQYAPQWFQKGLDLLMQFLDSIEQNIGQVVDKGASIIIKFLEGLDRNMPQVANKGVETLVKFVNAVSGAVESHTGEMSAAGRRLAVAIADGMSGGLISKASSIASAAWDLGKRAINAIRDATDTHSPSREAYKVGAFFGDGFAIAMDDKSDKVARSAENMGSSAVQALNETMDLISQAVNQNMDSQPTITPVIDLTAVKQSSGQLSRMISANNASISADVTTNSAKQAQVAYDDRQAFTNADGTSAAKVVNFKYEQTNNSPKSLSDVEIYRQTNNQLSTVKKALGL
jgi:tape measure domain-containing protein